MPIMDCVSGIIASHLTICHCIWHLTLSINIAVMNIAIQDFW